MNPTDLNTPQPPPTSSESRPIWELVIEDMRARDAAGRAKYGTPLQAGNGRNALVDAYQEALDLSVYLRQAIEERSTDASAQLRAELAEAEVTRLLTACDEHSSRWAEAREDLARLREAAGTGVEKLLMLRSYLGHQDQDADHAWMADQMREASAALSAALGTGDAKPDNQPPTHRCKVCGALWRLNEPDPLERPESPAYGRRTWSLTQASCGPCCDNVVMGDQIEPLPGTGEGTR